jgi:hypothetical protein
VPENGRNPVLQIRIPDPMLYDPLDPGSGSGMNYLFYCDDLHLKPLGAKKVVFFMFHSSFYVGAVIWDDKIFGSGIRYGKFLDPDKTSRICGTPTQQNAFSYTPAIVNNLNFFKTVLAD